MNGLRGVAIAAVVWHHTWDVLVALPASERVRALVSGVAPVKPGVFLLAPLATGWFGVRLFFVLSGFVLMLPYARGLRVFTDWAATRDFYRHRARRLLPLFAIVVLVCSALAYPTGSRTTLAELGLTLTGVFTFSTAYGHPRFNAVLWSLGVELWFCAIFPLLARAMLRFGAPPCFGVTLVLALASAFVERSGALGDFSLLFFIYLDGFVAGMSVACWLAARKTLRQPAALTSAGILCAYVASVLTVASQTAFLPAWIVDFAASLSTLGFAAILAGLVFAERGLLRSLVANPFLQVTGMMCYSLYLWHYVLLLRFASRDQGELLRYPLFLAILLALAALTYRYVEFGHERDYARLFQAIRDGSAGAAHSATSYEVATSRATSSAQAPKR